MKICQEIDKFLKSYNRSVIQLKTMKGKLEEESTSDGLFKTSNITISEIKDAINSCDMRLYLNKDTLANYAKDKKQVSLTPNRQSTQPEQQSEININTVQQIDTSQVRLPKQQKGIGSKSNQTAVKADQLNQFNRFLNNFSNNIMQFNNQPPLNCLQDSASQSSLQQPIDYHIQYSESLYNSIQTPIIENEFNSLLQQYKSIFTEDPYVLKQRLMIDIENIQMYLKANAIDMSQGIQQAIAVFDKISQVGSCNAALGLQSNQRCPQYQNPVFNVINNSIYKVSQNKEESSDTLDMNYSLFSQQVQLILDMLTNKGDEWQQSLLIDIKDLIIPVTQGSH